MSEDRRRRDRDDVFLEANNVFIDADKVIIRANDIIVKKEDDNRHHNVEDREQEDRNRRNFLW